MVTDGELSSSWFGFFFEGLEGFRLEPAPFKFRDADGRPTIGRPAWPARMGRRGPITLGEFERANALVRRPLGRRPYRRLAPSIFFRLGGSAAQTYGDVSGFCDDLIAVHRAELARTGCRLSNSTRLPIAMLCGPDVSRQAQSGDPATLIDT